MLLSSPTLALFLFFVIYSLLSTADTDRASKSLSIEEPRSNGSLPIKITVTMSDNNREQTVCDPPAVSDQLYTATPQSARSLQSKKLLGRAGIRILVWLSLLILLTDLGLQVVLLGMR